MKKTMMNYEAPVAEMIEMQSSMVLMASGEGEVGNQVNTQTGDEEPGSF
jgi:hypothetical protein